MVKINKIDEAREVLKMVSGKDENIELEIKGDTGKFGKKQNSKCKPFFSKTLFKANFQLLF